MIVKVGTNTIEGDKKSKLYYYSDVKYQKGHWADPKYYLPLDYDLLHLKIEGKEELLPGWCIGSRWEGYRLKPEDKILAWKKA